MLTAHEVVPYLLSRKLVTPQSVVEGNIAVVDLSRRNRNFKVISPAGCYLLKQAVGPDHMETVAREASIYLMFSSEAANGLSGYLPKFHGYDAEQSILILEFVKDAETLREQHERGGRASARTAEQVANALAALHRMSTAKVDPNWSAFSQRLQVFSLHRPDLEIFRTVSSAGVELIKIIRRQRKLGDLLDQLRGEWKADEFIHGDVRGDNFLIPARPDSGRKRWLKMVDFEYGCKGDAAWDVGSVFAEYLSFWLFSIPFVGGAQPDRFLGLASFPLETVRPLIRSFWRRYVFSMKLEQSRCEELLLRAVKYCGARLLHIALEGTYASNSIAAVQIYLLQVGMNVLLQPEKAAVELLRIRPSDEGHDE
jgi:thiamine kinase-like enzyme